MAATKADIITQLRKDILPLQGFKTALKNTAVDANLGPIKNAFPNASFPLGAIHEFIFSEAEDLATTVGFISGILAPLMHNAGVSIWISSSKSVFPPALQSFGIAPDKIIFIQLKKEKEILWSMEEALKCSGVAAVIGEMQELSFTASRRLQLAVEQSHVTGFVFRRNPRNLNTTACITRWKITSSLSGLTDMPGIGFPRWNVELLKVRNGKPGKWQIEFFGGNFRYIPVITAIPLEQQKKTG
ncbi:Error-prone repair protein ImuA [Ginsengibacter hankyongi]|uniref:Error-prone repair protein ImuA n=1 Tax=Ginsengibacter hankyongi TaxID=2607284 RepID=A0A5J5IER1_9BACT|nr:Error-prone repair protein ImuA [Ginsengibacter hankyongi]KAA9034438.1 Error-prone repair protein ImuA [Ginsengibacter hankyongi]